MTIRLIKIQKASVIDSDTENETPSAGECACASTAQWTEDNISIQLKDSTGVSGVTIECNNPQSISEITELIFGNDFFELVASQTNLYHQQNEKPYKKYDKALKWTNITNSGPK